MTPRQAIEGIATAMIASPEVVVVVVVGMGSSPGLQKM